MDNVKAWPARRRMKAFLVALAVVTAAPAALAERAVGEREVPVLEAEGWIVALAGTEPIEGSLHDHASATYARTPPEAFPSAQLRPQSTQDRPCTSGATTLPGD